MNKIHAPFPCLSRSNKCLTRESPIRLRENRILGKGKSGQVKDDQMFGKWQVQVGQDDQMLDNEKILREWTLDNEILLQVRRLVGQVDLQC